MSRAANTLLSDINEIYVGYLLAGKKWFSPEAKSIFEQRKKQAKEDEVLDAMNKSIVMAQAFLEWAWDNEYSGNIQHVYWCARAGSMSKAVGHEVDQNKNPADILVKFASGPAHGFLGLSAKSALSYKDPSIKSNSYGKVDLVVGTSLMELYSTEKYNLFYRLGLPVESNDLSSSSATRIRNKILDNPTNRDIRRQVKLVNDYGNVFLLNARNHLYETLTSLDYYELLAIILDQWLNADVINPPYVKVSGKGSKAPYHASVENPLKNKRLSALSKFDISLEPLGNNSIGIWAGDTKILLIRFKFNNKPMRSNVELNVSLWN